eukprot:16437935-Heterocapsa_arctica.AAC.1
MSNTNNNKCMYNTITAPPSVAPPFVRSQMVLFMRMFIISSMLYFGLLRSTTTTTTTTTTITTTTTKWEHAHRIYVGTCPESGGRGVS